MDFMRMTKEVMSKLDRKHLLITRAKRKQTGSFRFIPEQGSKNSIDPFDDAKPRF